MQAVVLAAGESSRFYPYNSLGHKSLITLFGKTLIERTIDSIRKSGIKNIVVVEDSKNSVSKKIGNKFKDIKFVMQKKPLGMGDALLKAEGLLEDEFFVVGGYHFEFGNFAKEMKDSKKKDTDVVVLTKDEKDLSQFGAIKKVNGKVSVKEKTESAGERIIGIYLLNKKFIEVLNGVPKSHYNFEDAISKFSDTYEIVVLKTAKETISLKFPWDLLVVKDYLFKNLESGKSVEKGAKIMEGAILSEPYYIGKNAYVGTNSIIRAGTVIEEGARVGAQMEVKNSILMKNSSTHSGFIGDSIVGENTKIAASFNTGNVRLDRREVNSLVKNEKINTHLKNLGAIIGSNASFGIKVGTMPGIIIGNDVIVGPGTTVMENIEDNTTYYAEFKKNVQKKNDAKK